MVPGLWNIVSRYINEMHNTIQLYTTKRFSWFLFHKMSQIISTFSNFRHYKFFYILILTSPSQPTSVQSPKAPTLGEWSAQLALGQVPISKGVIVYVWVYGCIRKLTTRITSMLTVMSIIRFSALLVMFSLLSFVFVTLNCVNNIPEKSLNKMVFVYCLILSYYYYDYLLFTLTPGFPSTKCFCFYKSWR